jgi:hypothetical protein
MTALAWRTRVVLLSAALFAVFFALVIAAAKLPD